MRPSILALALCLAVSAGAPRAQTATGAIAGTAKDAQGVALPGVAVQLTAPSQPTRSTVSNANGEFHFNAVPIGTYRLTATLSGFQTYTATVKVAEKTTARIAVVMQVGALAETLRVEAAAPYMAGLAAPPPPPSGPVNRTRPRFNTESYDRIDENPFLTVANEPLSTFSIDVDTASYANIRRFLTRGSLPPRDAVRIEEMINYFRFEYSPPRDGAPFSVTTELAPCPWNARHRLALIGLQAPALDAERVPPRNLVFLLDVSGSMMPDDKLPLVKTAMRMLVDTLRPEDRIAIVVYAGASGLVLPSTSGDRKDTIHAAIAALEAGGSTNGAAGITLAYQVAREQFARGGINRVILATDGDFNVGVTNQGDLTRLIEEQRASGIYLSVLGVGTGNVKDSTMEKLADRGNGNYAYLDSLHEARKVLVREGGATLVTVAKDVKIQVEFNPARVGAYRLIGYENRMLRKEDFNDDKKDAGEIGAGHTVTALYEIVPPGEPIAAGTVDPLKYQRPAAPTRASDELMTVKLRYKAPTADDSRLIAVPVKDRAATAVTANVGFAAAVAEFGMLLRQSEHRGTASYAEAATLARRFRGADAEGYRAEFVRLVELAESLARHSTR